MPLFKRVGPASSARLTRVTGDPPAFSDLTDAFIANVEKLGTRITTYPDDATAGER